MKDLKNLLFDYCTNFVDTRIAGIQKIIDAAQASANEEGKSSAGDKYETGRAMAQLEIEKNTVQLAEAIRLKQVLNQAATLKPSEKASLGSLIKTSNGYYYLSISIGPVKIDSETVFVISQASPIGRLLTGTGKNDKITFGTQQIHILDIL